MNGFWTIQSNIVAKRVGAVADFEKTVLVWIKHNREPSEQ